VSTVGTDTCIDTCILWSASNDFTDAARAMHPGLDAWQKYAQVILMSNELVFVD
jgi:hypothetical protein